MLWVFFNLSTRRPSSTSEHAGHLQPPAVGAPYERRRRAVTACSPRREIPPAAGCKLDPAGGCKLDPTAGRELTRRPAREPVARVRRRGWAPLRARAPPRAGSTSTPPPLPAPPIPAPPIPMDKHAHQSLPAPSSLETPMAALLHVPSLARSLVGCGAASRCCSYSRGTSPARAPPSMLLQRGYLPRLFNCRI
jgi:hypothetical protein